MPFLKHGRRCHCSMCVHLRCVRCYALQLTSGLFVRGFKGAPGKGELRTTNPEWPPSLDISVKRHDARCLECVERDSETRKRNRSL